MRKILKTATQILFFAVIFSLMAYGIVFGYTRSWTESTPTDATVANQIDDFNRYLRVDVAERLETYIGGFNASDSNAGFYQVLFLEQASFSTPAANKYVMGGKLVGGKCEFVGKDEDGDEIQLSYTGKHMIGSGTAPQAFMYNTTDEDTDGGRESTIRAKGDQSGAETTTLGYIEFSHDGSSDDQKGRFRIMLNDGDDSDAPSKSAIEYASDGTIDVTNSVSVLDEDAMGSDSATKLATQQSIKAYVDTQDTSVTAFGAYSRQDDDSANMVKAHAYLTNQDGTITAYVESNSGVKVLNGYIDGTSDPAGAGELIASNEMTITGHMVYISMPVASGQYFEITTTSSNEPVIYWHPVGTLVKCTDQD